MPDKLLRLRIAGLHDAGHVAALKRSLGLVANVQGVTVDADAGDAHVIGDVDEHLVLVHLANEGFEVHPIHDAPRHPAH